MITSSFTGFLLTLFIIFPLACLRTLLLSLREIINGKIGGGSMEKEEEEKKEKEREREVEAKGESHSHPWRLTQDCFQHHEAIRL